MIAAEIAGRADSAIQTVVAVVVFGGTQVTIDAFRDRILVLPFNRRAIDARRPGKQPAEQVIDVLRVEVSGNPGLSRDTVRAGCRTAISGANGPSAATCPFTNRHRVARAVGDITELGVMYQVEHAELIAGNWGRRVIQAPGIVGALRQDVVCSSESSRRKSCDCTAEQSIRR